MAFLDLTGLGYFKSKLLAYLSDNYAVTTHQHGNITNDGKVGTASGVPLITGNGGIVQAGSFGTTAGTFCEGNDSRLSDARTPTAHNQASNTINAMTGYSKAASASAIGTGDTLNTAIGKLEKALDGKSATGHSHTTQDVTALTGYSIAATADSITASDSLNTALGKLQKSIDGKQASGSYAPATHNQASDSINAMTGYSKAGSYTAISASDSLNTAVGKLEAGLSDVSATITGGIKVKGSLGTGGTITALPASHSLGDAYYAIAGAPNVSGTALEAGDMVICIKAGTTAKDADWIVVQNNADTMKGATASAAGTRGFVPAPAAGDQSKVLSGAGTWVTNTDVNVTNTLNTTAKAYLTGTTSATTNTGSQVFDTGVFLTTTAGELQATNFVGKINNHTVNVDVPANAVFTDTTYDAITNAEIDGLFA